MKILVVDEIHPALWENPSLKNVQIDYRPEINRSEAEAIIKQYEGLVIRSKFKIDEVFLDNAQNLLFIGRAGAGLDLIDLAACEQRGIQVVAANEANKVAVAEHALGMILNLFTKICLANYDTKKLNWQREAFRGIELSGRNVGIIGFGNNGSETARLFRGLGCTVYAYDKYKSGYGEVNILESDLEEISTTCEIISFHVPLTTETFGLFSGSFIEKVQKPFYLINVARGEIVNLADLLGGLRTGKILGACLDVIPNEKPESWTADERAAYQDLFAHPAVLVTPHVAGWTVESYQKISEVLRDKICDFISQNINKLR